MYLHDIDFLLQLFEVLVAIINVIVIWMLSVDVE